VIPRTVRFHEFERESGRRIRHRRVAEGMDPSVQPEGRWEPPLRPPAALPEEPTGAGRPPGPSGGGYADERMPRPAAEEEMDVPFQDVMKGYEVAPGQFVMLSPEELRALRPERSRTIDVQEFVSLDDIDPIYYDRSYYVSPGRGVGAEKPYTLLLRALQRSRKVGIGSFVLTSRLHLAAIRPRQDILVLETLFYGDEVRATSEIDFPPTLAEPSARELDVAVRLIELLEAGWDPSRFRDEYRQRVLELIGSKAPDAVAIPEMTEPAGSSVADLMAALQESVERARKASSGHPRSRRRTG